MAGGTPPATGAVLSPTPLPTGATNNITSRSAWAAALLGLIGAPPTANNINTIVAWETAEGGAGPQFGVKTNVANYNPLNVTLKTGVEGYGYDPGTGQYYPGATPTPGNNPPVASFVSWVQGLTATAGRLQQPFAQNIVSALKANAPEATVAAQVGSSGWGTGDFAGVTGSDTATTTSTGGTAAGPTSIAGGIPGTLPPNPGIGLNPISSLSSQVQWLGEFLGWSLFIVIVFILGVVFMLLGLALLISIFLGPAVGPITAAVGKRSPGGKLVGLAANIGGNREPRESGVDSYRRDRYNSEPRASRADYNRNVKGTAAEDRRPHRIVGYPDF